MKKKKCKQNIKEWCPLLEESESRGIRKYKKVDSWICFCNLILNKFILTDKKEQNDSKRLILKDYVWRGHRGSSWKLVASFDRNRNPASSPESILDRHLTSFVYACRGKLAEFGIQIKDLKRDIREDVINKNHIWALGQHYGLATPLLDWCISPFVAAYFAFAEETSTQDSEERAVIGLKVKEVCANTHLVFFDPMSSEHSRLINQRGLFTTAKNGECIKKIVRKNWKNGDDPWLIKILIPNDKRKEFLRGLNLMNINHMSLFPDIYGAAQFCNIGIEEGMDGYALFHGQGP